MLQKLLNIEGIGKNQIQGRLRKFQAIEATLPLVKQIEALALGVFEAQKEAGVAVPMKSAPPSRRKKDSDDEDGDSAGEEGKG